MKRPSAFFINGGAGRVICSIPALEKYAEDNPNEDFLIVCEAGTDFYKGHPKLYHRVYDVWHKNLFRERLVNMDVKTPEPYRVWEYYNQQASLAQAFDIDINNKGLRDLQKPKIKLSTEELIQGQLTINEVRQKTGKDKVVVFQPYGRGVTVNNEVVYDSSGRSFDYKNVVNIVKKLQKNYAVILMAEFQMNFEAEGAGIVAQPQQIHIRQWAGIIAACDHFLGCDSVGQHIAYSLNRTATVVLGSTFAVNVSYPEYEKFDILDMGEGLRKYSPIRICPDEDSDRTNDGIMIMNEKIEDVIVKSVDTLVEKYYTKPMSPTLPKISGTVASPAGGNPQQPHTHEFQTQPSAVSSVMPAVTRPKLPIAPKKEQV
jgi:ADP-heptose:LPS heptosyltransferase